MDGGRNAGFIKRFVRRRKHEVVWVKRAERITRETGKFRDLGMENILL